MIEKTSAELLEKHIAGRLVAGNVARAPGDVIVQIFSRHAVQDSFIVPAVAEPLVVWVLAGEATVEERDLGGAWIGNDVKAGQFFIADSDEPYELRWRTRSGQSFDRHGRRRHERSGGLTARRQAAPVDLTPGRLPPRGRYRRIP